MNELNYRKEDHFHPMEAPQLVHAELYAQIETEPGHFLEGTWFGDADTMYYTTTYHRQLVKFDMKTKERTVVYETDEEDVCITSVKIGPDGKFYLSCIGTLNTLGKETNKGKVIVLNADYSFDRVLCNGYQVDDITFDSKGGFYFANYEGTESDRCGSVGYMDPERTGCTIVYPNLAGPNGVALSPDEKILWITETRCGRLDRYDINGRRTYVPFYFMGGTGPDSCEVDADGNLYVAFYGHGCVSVFNDLGHPIANILIPGREVGKNLDVTHPTVRPGYKEVYITVNDSSGCAIYRCGSFAPGIDKKKD